MIGQFTCIACDCCGERVAVQPALTLEVAVATLGFAGWVGAPGGKHFCTVCKRDGHECVATALGGAA